MTLSKRNLVAIVTAALLSVGMPFGTSARGTKSYSSGSRSYSSHSSSSSSGGSHSFSSGSHSFSSGSSGSSTHTFSGGSGSSTHTFSSGSSSGSTPSHTSGLGTSATKTFSSGSGSGKSYGSGSTWSDSGRHSYSSGKSYSSGSSGTGTSSSSSSSRSTPPPIPSSSKSDSAPLKSYSSGNRSFSSGSEPSRPSSSQTAPKSSDPASSSFAFDSAAARAQKEQTSKGEFNRFKESKTPPVTTSAGGSQSYRGTPLPIPSSGGSYSRTPTYVPTAQTVSTRPARIYNYYGGYYSRPIVYYHDPYNSFFWWWLLDRSLDDRAYWAYHHRYDMDPSRYQALMATDQNLETRVAQLENQQVARDPNYVPAAMEQDRDLMYTDRYVNHTYSNRPTRSGNIVFWFLAVPTALGVSAFFIWLIWFKRWQTAAA
jgi:hypothetical protein